MQTKCANCGKIFSIPTITQLVNLCDECKRERAFANYDLPEGFDTLFNKGRTK